jgi:glucosamine 6-phosphate synthetase-like amidotransferase/phosphosugar isomerase protein
VITANRQERHSIARPSACTGHTRKPTKGEVGHSKNNHPILTKYVIGIHNGEIKNDDDLFGEYSMPRNGQVDSEAIFALLDTVPAPLNGKEYKNRIISIVDRLSGRLTTVSMDMRRPGELLILKRDMPFSMHYEPSLNALFFSSRYVFLRKAFGRSVITEALPTKQGYIFKLDEFDRLENRYSDTFLLLRKQ